MKWGWNGREATSEDILQCVDNGWSGILTRLIDDLASLGWNGEIYQVKEKFGGLRFYIGSASEEVHARIRQAERESTRTCEVCGDAGELRGGGWIKALCDVHAEDRPHLDELF